MIEIQDIAYVRSGAADLKTAVDFAVNIVGLELVATHDGTAMLRADHRHHCLALVEGESGVLSSGFTLRDEAALAAAEAELNAAGITTARGTAEQAYARRVREFIVFDDPFGNRLELVVGQVSLARPVNFARTAGITEFGHLCFDAPNVREAYAFYSGLFNLKVSDWIGDGACLMRFNAVHHTVAIFRGDNPGLCHMNFQVETIDDVMRSWHFLEENDVEITMGPGRHPQSTAVFLYFKGPEGFTYEYSWNVRLIEDDDAWVPRYFDPSEPDAVDMWRGRTSMPQAQPQVKRALGE